MSTRLGIRVMDVRATAWASRQRAGVLVVVHTRHAEGNSQQVAAQGQRRGHTLLHQSHDSHLNSTIAKDRSRYYIPVWYYNARRLLTLR